MNQSAAEHRTNAPVAAQSQAHGLFQLLALGFDPFGVVDGKARGHVLQRMPVFEQVQAAILPFQRVRRRQSLHILEKGAGRIDALGLADQRVGDAALVEAAVDVAMREHRIRA